MGTPAPMTRQEIIHKWAAYLIALLLIGLLDYYALGQTPIALPLLMPSAAVAAGTLEGPAFGAAYGFFAGMVMAGFGHESVACLAVLCFAGWLTGIIAQNVLRRDFFGHMICAAGLLALWEAWQVWSRYRAGVASLEVLAQVALPELGWSLAFSLPVYWVMLFCCVFFGRIRNEA